MKPKIRFKGFDDAYYENKFSQLFNTISDSGHNVSSNEYCKRGTYPVIDQSKDYIVGYTDVVAPIIPKGGIIVFGDHTRELKYVDFPFCTGADGTQLLSPKSKDIPMYLYYYCKSLKIPNTGYNRHFKYIKETIYNIPLSTKEQQVIASFFDNLDSQISASASRLASLKQIKAASLQAMFPKEGETMPKVRFKGFKGEWKKVKFSEIFEFLKNNSLSRAKLSNEGEVANVHYGDVLIKFGDLLNVQSEELTYITDNRVGYNLYTNSCLQDGDVIITDAAEDNTVGKCLEIMNVGNMKIVSGLHTIPCRPFKCFAQGYLGHYMNSESYHGQLLPLIQGSKISSISKKVLSQTSVFVPSLEEQQKIAVYFTSLDRQITLHSQRLEKLKQIKAACLDKMFV